jgi:hypothetical protein
LLLILLVAGTGLVIVGLLRSDRGFGRLVSRPMVLAVVTGTLAMIALLGLDLMLIGLDQSASGLESVTNPNDLSISLFVFYELIALVPMAAALGALAPSATQPPNLDSHSPPITRLRRRPGGRGASWSRRARQVTLALLIAIPLSIGLGVTVTEAPSYLHSHVTDFANITTGDLAALNWAGAHLPSCSRVLVAVASAAQYLPEFAAAELVFPSYPPATNQSYHTATQDLVQGTYTNATRADLLSLGVTEVFVTGQTSVSYPPFLERPLLGSPDFTSLFLSGDAGVFLFVPGSLASGCAPT